MTFAAKLSPSYADGLRQRRVRRRATARPPRVHGGEVFRSAAAGSSSKEDRLSASS